MTGLLEDNPPDPQVDAGTNVVTLYPSGPAHSAEIVSFNRRELNQILHVYGLMVAEGEWRDYAIDMLGDRAVFSVFRRSSELPLYRIEKNPKLSRRQGAYSVVNATGQILKRGHELGNVLRFFERKPKLFPV